MKPDILLSLEAASTPLVVDATPWDTVLIVALAASGLLVFGYRAYRVGKGGPMADAIGGAALALLLGVVAALIGNGVEWARWPALVYGLLFGVIVMPVWVLGVFIPSRPGALDWAWNALYWLTLVVVVVAALAV